MTPPEVTTATLLLEMRREQREDHKTLATTVVEGFDKLQSAMATHVLEDTSKFATLDARLDVVESTRKTVRWFGATVIVAAVGAIIELLVVHR
jgi:hypothetical protein